MLLSQGFRLPKLPTVLQISLQNSFNKLVILERQFCILAIMRNAPQTKILVAALFLCCVAPVWQHASLLDSELCDFARPWAAFWSLNGKDTAQVASPFIHLDNNESCRFLIQRYYIRSFISPSEKSKRATMNLWHVYILKLSFCLIEAHESLSSSFCFYNLFSCFATVSRALSFFTAG